MSFAFAVPPQRLETAGDVDRREGDVDADSDDDAVEPEEQPGFAPGDTPDDASGMSGEG